ncbi:DUF6249 domain-containing protein [Caulobacter endophyticus]|uniref:DUF6249 domain-containing protein n=1 Tax=Caulobacter endophyticus TaxID=2172652 RepID=UPI00240FC677|nr:DUF6249 domain-containing protein [Caulobacter endophyticus]MDG2529529.1 DUF6249 domain-containing protein [Caulobacter endophyticus]
MELGILVPLAPFIMVVCIVVIPMWLKSRDRREMQATVRAAIEKGQPLPPELIEALSKEVKPPRESSALRDMRVGVILIAVGAGLAVLGFMLGQIADEALHPVMGAAAIPALIGVAYVILSFFNPNKGHRLDA